jgi:hypothetical protein
MNGLQWCGWCCCLRYPLCCDCRLCMECCRCPPAALSCFCPPDPMPQMPCLGPPPPPIRIIREHVLVPFPYPVCPKPRSCLPRCWQESQGSYECENSCLEPSPIPERCLPRSWPILGGGDSYRKTRKCNLQEHPTLWSSKDKRFGTYRKTQFLAKVMI